MTRLWTNALQMYNEDLETPRLYTGFPNLDGLLGGGLRAGSFCLFYGGEDSGVDFILHKALVNSLLPLDEHGLGGRALYVNCGNYKYERTIMDIELIGRLAKASRLDYREALNRIHAVCAFSEEQQEAVVEETAKLIEGNPEIRLVAVQNLAKLWMETAHTPNKKIIGKIPRLQQVVSRLVNACAKHKATLLASARPYNASPGRIPTVEGGKFLRHAAHIILYLRRIGRTEEVQAYLVKHPAKPPRGINFTWKEGETMGRVTIPFRTRWELERDELKKAFREALMDEDRQQAFDDLVKVWSSEVGAMSQCNVPTVLDVMMLTAIVDDRKMINQITKRLDGIENKLDTVIKTLNIQPRPVILSQTLRFLGCDLPAIE